LGKILKISLAQGPSQRFRKINKMENWSTDEIIISKTDVKNVIEKMLSDILSTKDNNSSFDGDYNIHKRPKLNISLYYYPEGLLYKALKDVFSKFDWITYNNFRKTINDIMGDKNIPFTSKIFDNVKKVKDVWIVHMYVFVGNREYEYNKRYYSKREILLSKDFRNYLIEHCSTILKDEVVCKFFAGPDYASGNIELLDMNKATKQELISLSSISDLDANKFVLISFRKRFQRLYKIDNIGEE